MLASIHSHDFSMPSEVHQQLIVSKIYFFFIDGYIPQVKNSQYLAYSGIVVVVVLAFADFFFFLSSKNLKFYNLYTTVELNKSQLNAHHS